MNVQLKKELLSGLVRVPDLNKNELLSVGFVTVADEDLLRIPMWAYSLLPYGTELISTVEKGKCKIKGKDFVCINTRRTFLAYGIKVI